MRILLWHGYLLTGSGSNLYTANIARVWRRQGHDVLLMCQERDLTLVDFVDAAADFDDTNTSFTFTDLAVEPAGGRCRLLRPNIGGLLPVYVYDEYEGFEVKRFVDLDDDELARYTDRNVTALASAIEHFEPEAIITGHEVMGPYIARKACRASGSEYIAKLHGSALEYAVKMQDRYRSAAEIGLDGARVVTGGSRYMLEEAASVIPGWRDRGVIVNPGCDVELFRPVDKEEPPVPTVAYVGKFIASKGVHNLLAALGLTKDRLLRVQIIGYGGFENELHDLWDALKKGDVDGARAAIRSSEERERVAALDDFLRGGLPSDYVQRLSSVDLDWPGRLDHGPLSKVLPLFDVLVVPSVVPEAFGMVGAEAAASAVLPIVPRHSGIGEVGAAVEEAIEKPNFLSYDPESPIEGIAAGIDRVLDADWATKRRLGLAAARFASEEWSWETVADKLLRLAAAR